MEQKFCFVQGFAYKQKQKLFKNQWHPVCMQNKKPRDLVLEPWVRAWSLDMLHVQRCQGWWWWWWWWWCCCCCFFFYCQSSFVSLGGHQQLCSLIRPLGLDPKAAACRRLLQSNVLSAFSLKTSTQIPSVFGEPARQFTKRNAHQTCTPASIPWFKTQFGNVCSCKHSVYRNAVHRFVSFDTQRVPIRYHGIFIF